MVLVYTAILGDCDSLKPAPAGAECICFTDRDDLLVRDGWRFVWWWWPNWEIANARREAWRLRAVPHQLFGQSFDAIIWMDASLTITDLPRLLHDSADHEISGLRHHNRTDAYHEARELVNIGQSDADDVDRQMAIYRSHGFPLIPLTISCLLVRQQTAKVRLFNDIWDHEIRFNPGDNTQLSLDYAAWMNDLTVHHLEGSRHQNPYAVHDSADHKRRRKAYR